ncbi:hypothetical protein MVEN_00982300 [Mycena venus]|uniref:F-box domain-containing protein n=1 Tax=Mycena venus TaxID=2733690 RepID=A0A8H6YCA4_9AGAR|nr:hypothetical protein MVEN_00982300 [Mycena venus]
MSSQNGPGPPTLFNHEMHRSLCIPEIVDLIFTELQCGFSSDVDRNENLGRRDFAALARTCQRFRDPALDFLWREQETLINLLKCLPSYLWEESVHPEFRSRVFRITGPVCAADWAKPLTYALRIQTLDLKSGHVHDQDSNLFELISSGLPRDYLCPNLKRISWQYQGNDILFPYIRLFLGPKVVDATILLPNSGSHTSSLSGLALRFRDLKQLSLYTISPRHDSMLFSAVSKIALRLERIEAVIFDQLDRAAIEHLSQLPYLRFLNLNTIFGHSAHLCAETGHHPFPALRDLYFCDTTIDIATEFLDFLSDCCLQTLYVATAVSATKFQTGQMYIALARRLSHTALRTLRVELPHNYQLPGALEGGITNYVIDGRVLSALFCFSNLTELTLRPPAGFDIDDAVAWDMARAWPKLKSLHLEASHVHHPPSMSLHALRAFAKHCDDLADLTITIDASTVAPVDNSPEMRISQSTLTSFNVNKSPITDPLIVAPFISSLFPNLQEYRYPRALDVDRSGGRK